jgi:cobyrinic acid a,c-diamide synthase
MLRSAISPLGIPVLGVLRRDPELVWRDRHLGLVPVIERPTEVAASLGRLASRIDDSCDLEEIMAIARRSPAIPTGAPARPEPVGEARIAVAAGPAFSFCYPDNLDALAAAGAELVSFDPCADEQLPDGCTGLLAGGGFPEVYAEALSQNVALLADVHRRVADGLAVWAECGGLLWLCRSLDDRKLAGVIDADAVMTERLTLGYRQAVARTATPIGPVGTEVRGHEYHYSRLETPGSALALTGREGPSHAGFAGPRLLASYLHVHLGARPDLAEQFVRTCAPGISSSGGNHALRLPYMS